MFKKITSLNPANNKKFAILFSLLFLANSTYYVYHAIFTPFIEQLINCRLIYLFLIIAFILLSLLWNEKEKAAWKKIVKTLIFVLLPSAILILLGYLKYPENFKNNPQLFANLIIVSASFLIFLKATGYEKSADFFSDFKEKKISSETNKKKGDFALKFIVILVIALNLGFGSYHLAKFAAVDEPLWTFQRIPKFWNNVLDGEWQKTRISDKPGITTALISGIGIIWTNPKEYKLIEEENEIKITAGDVEKMNFPMRLPILVFNALALILIYFLLAKLLGRFNAAAGTIFIGLSPIMLGMSRIINPDSTLWIFSTLSLLNYFLFLKNSEKRYLLLTGVFLGLSLLTKYVANFFFIFYFVMIFFNYLLNKKGNGWKDYFKKSLGHYFIIVYLSLLTFFILLPAAWVDLGRITEGTIFSEAFYGFLLAFIAIILITLGEIYLLRGIISNAIFSYLSKNSKIIIRIIATLFLIAIIFTAVNTWFGMKWLNFEEILASPKSSKTIEGFSGLIFSDFYSLIFGIHPIALILIAFLSFYVIFSKKTEYKILPAYIMLFVFLYYLAYVINEIGATVRYQIIIYPLVFILASLGLRSILSALRCKEKICLSVLFILLLFLVLSLNKIRPFYFSYASEILPQKYILNLKDMGDGSYEAAEYLNNLPDAKNLIVWTDKIGVCYFFKGGCFSAFEMYRDMRIDYFVVSAGRQSRTIRQLPYKGRHNDFEIQIDKIYDLNNYDYRINIGGRPNNFIKIFSYEKLANEKQ